jgi:hypothetical protein
MGFLYPQLVDQRFALAALYGALELNDTYLEYACAEQFDALVFRQTVMVLLDDIALRGLGDAQDSVIYSLVQATGCTPEQAQQVVDHG